MYKRIGIVLGTRPEAIKLLPVYLECKRRGLDAVLISTGQHQSMLQQIFDFFEVTPDVSLDVMVYNQTLSGLTARLIDVVQELLTRQIFDAILVQGDTTTAMATSLVAFYNRIPVLHVEAGLRTYNKWSPFPEEINRQIVGRIADVHFAPTPLAKGTLEKEGVMNVHMVGNTVIDSLLLCLEKVERNKGFYESKFPKLHHFEKLVLITGHRRENFGQGFDAICGAIRQLSMRYPGILFYYPVHLNPNVKDKVHDVLSNLPNVYLDAPLPYDELVYLMSRSYLILTDSGGIQEEAPSLNVPVLVMRDTTERPEGVQAGCSKLVGTDDGAIINAFIELVENAEAYRAMTQVPNPYGDGHSAERIADIMLHT